MTNMRIYYVIFILLGTVSISFAQKENFRRLSIDVSGGKSVSLRELATQVFGIRRGELADDGWAGQAMVSYYPWRNLGFVARTSYNRNQTRHHGIILIASGQYNIINPVVESADDWTVITGMVGPSLRLGGQRLGIEGRLMVGYANVNSPTFATSGRVQGYDILVKTFSQKAGALAYGAGSTIYVGITKHIVFVANADATLVGTTFKGVKNQITSANLPMIEREVDIDQSVGILNLMGGLRFSF